MSEFVPLVRSSVWELESILGKRFPVLDDGFVAPIDYMGGDQSVVEAARISYGTGTKRVSEDRGLLRYLMRHHHDTPFEMATIKFHMRIPMDAWRQFVRHRLLSINEYSTRYSEAIDSAQRTRPDEWRAQSSSNKQGSAGVLTSWPLGYWDEHRDIEEPEYGPGYHLSVEEGNLQKLSRSVYEERLRLGVAREQARKDLPLSTYTEVIVECDLRGWLHFLWLRLDPHAQAEIRAYAEAIAEVVKVWTPWSWEAFEDYRLGAITFSAIEVGIIRRMLTGEAVGQTAPVEWYDLSRRIRERDEAEDKFEKIGLHVPWREAA